MQVWRRGTLLAMGLAAVLQAGGAAGAEQWRTTSSLIGESKYGEKFERYDYVNPDAPKGGTLNSTVLGTYDSFNP